MNPELELIISQTMISSNWEPHFIKSKFWSSRTKRVYHQKPSLNSPNASTRALTPTATVKLSMPNAACCTRTLKPSRISRKCRSSATASSLSKKVCRTSLSSIPITASSTNIPSRTPRISTSLGFFAGTLTPPSTIWIRREWHLWWLFAYLTGDGKCCATTTALVTSLMCH